MRIFLTGATGFVGVRAIEILVKRYGREKIVASHPVPANDVERGRADRIHRLGVSSLVWDLLEPYPSGEALPAFDAIIHLGAFTTTEVKSDRVRVNDEGTRNLIESLSEHLPGKVFLFTSTQMVVDKAGPANSVVNEDSPCHPRTEYGRTKLKAEGIVRKSAQRLGFSYVILRPPTVYGPGFRDSGMFGLFARWAACRFSPADIDWTGIMGLLYLDDLIEVMIRLLESEDPRARDDTFFVSSPERLTMGEITRGIAEATGSTVRSIRIPRWIEKIVEGLTRQDWLWRHFPHIIHIMAWRLSLIIGEGYYGDASRLMEVLPGMSYLPFSEGVKRTYSAL